LLFFNSNKASTTVLTANNLTNCLSYRSWDKQRSETRFV